MTAWWNRTTAQSKPVNCYFSAEICSIYTTNSRSKPRRKLLRHLRLRNGYFPWMTSLISSQAFFFLKEKKMAADLKTQRRMCPVELFILYENDSLFIKYNDGTSLELSPCGSSFLHCQVQSRKVEIRQLTRFAVSSFRSKILAAVRIRNLYAVRPYLCKELTGQEELKVRCCGLFIVFSFKYLHNIIQEPPIHLIYCTLCVHVEQTPRHNAKGNINITFSKMHSSMLVMNKIFWS